jgi:Flp pilus assembly protein TadB
MSGPAAAARTSGRGWSLERVLFAIAGSVTLGSVVLGVLVSPWFLALTAFVGANQLLYVLVGDCPMSVILRRTCNLQEAGR